MASPPSPRGRAPRTASALASSSSSCGSCAHARAGLLRTARGRRAGRRPPRRCAPRRRSRRRAEAPTLSTATPMPASAHSAERLAPAARRRRRSPGRARPSARRRAARARASQSPASRRPGCRTRRRCAGAARGARPSALTATLPLCETSATWPGLSRHERVAPERRAVVAARRSRCRWARTPAGRGGAPRRRSAACSAAPSGVSPKPAAKTTAPPQPRAPACSITAGTPAAGIATTTASTAPRAGRPGRHAGHAVHALARRVDAPHAPAEADAR